MSMSLIMHLAIKQRKESFLVFFHINNWNPHHGKSSLHNSKFQLITVWHQAVNKNPMLNRVQWGYDYYSLPS